MSILPSRSEIRLALADPHEWHRALRALNLRPRKFYATRHAFISLVLTRGARIKWVAEYVGTSVEMIERHYGRYLGADTASQLALLDGEGRESPRRAEHRDSSRNSGRT